MSEQSGDGALASPDDAPPTVRRVRRRMTTEPLGYVAPLDGMRALAVGAVLLYHARFSWIPGGYLGVSAFFTLSGFLITSLLVREWTRSDGIEIRTFWRRRFRRLLPASWTTMLIVVAMGALGVWDNDQLRSLRGDVPFALLEIINWHFIAQDRSYGAEFAAPSPLEHFWSLAVEQQFYILLPALVIGLLVVGRRPQRQRIQTLVVVLAGLTVVSVVLNGVLARSSIDRAYFGTDTRMAEMLIGSLLACATLRRLRLPPSIARHLAIALGVIGLAVSVWLWHAAPLNSSWMYPWGLLLCAVCTAAIIYSALQGGVLAALLSLPPLLWLGRISYGVYLLHWPIFLWLSPARIGWSQWPLFGLRMAVTLVAAVVMFRLIEDPVRHGRQLRAHAAPLSAAVMVVLLLGGTFVVTRDLPPPSELARASDGATPTTAPPPPVKALIVGDQSATALGDALTGTEGLDVSVSAVPDCGLALGGWVTLPSGVVERDALRCDTAQQTWVDAIATAQPDVVLVSTGSRDLADRRLAIDGPWEAPDGAGTDAFLRSEFARALDDLTAAGTEVIVVTAPTRVDTVSPAELPPVPEGATETAAGLLTAELAQIAAGAPAAGFHANEPARIDHHNQLLREVAAGRNVAVIDLATETAGATLEPEAQAVVVDGRLTLDAEALGELTEWLVRTLRERAPQAVAAPSPPPFAADAPLPEAPPERPRRVATSGPVTALFVGDSTNYALAGAAEKWGAANGELDVVNATQFGCAVARGGEYRFQRDLRVLEERCDWATFVPQQVAGQRPEVAVLSSGIWEVVDRRLGGDDRYRDITDPSVARYVLVEFLSMIDALGADGANVVVLTQPYLQSGLDQGFQDLPESEPARIDRLNELLAEAVSLRPGVATLIDTQAWLASTPGGELDASKRPDGVHFTDEYSATVIDWLAPQLVEIGRGSPQP